MQILITGTAGFIGSFLAERLAFLGHTVYGVDSINDYYDPQLKLARLQKGGIVSPAYGEEARSTTLPGYVFRRADLCDKAQMEAIFTANHFDCVVNLAAQAGVRYSIENPEAYIQSNVCGFLNVLEGCRRHGCQRLVYASSSSVYGNAQHVPFSEENRVDTPVSLYAATKKSNELMAFTYSHLYGIQSVGLRFFTVYGPYGRPDMAPILFADSIMHGRVIRIFNHGDLSRDFTYIDDIVDGIVRVVEHPESACEDTQGTRAAVYNIGHGSPVRLMDFVGLLEASLGREARKEYVGMQAGDVYQTWADTHKLERDFGYRPSTSLEEGVKRFAEWFLQR